MIEEAFPCLCYSPVKVEMEQLCAFLILQKDILRFHGARQCQLLGICAWGPETYGSYGQSVRNLTFILPYISSKR